MMFRRALPISPVRIAAAFAALVGLWPAACLQPDDSGDYFSLEVGGDAGPSLLACTRVTVGLEDTAGRPLAVLYDDTLPSLDRLRRLPAGPYAGGRARIRIEGYRGNSLAYRETRLYDGNARKVLAVEVESFGDPKPEAAPPAQPPAIPAFPRDTTVSIGDSVPLIADAYDPDGDLAGYAWTCGGGAPADSGRLGGAGARIRYGARFSAPGRHSCVLRVRDARNLETSRTAAISVVLDPPWADAGRDTTVTPGSIILLHARGEDGFGPIVSRAWSVGGAPFQPVGQTESTLAAPDRPGDLQCILRVTDTDSLSAFDTLIVHVVAPE